MKKTVFLLIRLSIATSFLGHGLVRITKIDQFSAYITEAFRQSILPSFLVSLFGHCLPVFELLEGLLLLLGLFTKQVAIAGIIVMMMLIFGSSLIEEWGALPSQFIHIAFLLLLLQYIDHNKCALDNLIKCHKCNK